MKVIKVWTAALARVLMSAGFLIGGIIILFNWHETEANFIFTLCEWQSHLSFCDQAQECFAFLNLWSACLLAAAILCLLGGGLLVLLGIKEKWGAFLLVLFLIPQTLLYYPFWFFEGAERDIHTGFFLSHCAIVGGLLLMILNGGKASGQFSSSFKM